MLTFSVAKLDSPETFKELIFVRSLLQLTPAPAPVAVSTCPVVPVTPDISRPLTRFTIPVLSMTVCADWLFRPPEVAVMKNVPSWSTTTWLVAF